MSTKHGIRGADRTCAACKCCVQDLARHGVHVCRCRHEAEFILNWNKFAERVPIFGSGMFLPGRVRRFFEQHAQVPTTADVIGSRFGPSCGQAKTSQSHRLISGLQQCTMPASCR